MSQSPFKNDTKVLLNSNASPDDAHYVLVTNFWEARDKTAFVTFINLFARIMGVQSTEFYRGL